MSNTITLHIVMSILPNPSTTAQGWESQSPQLQLTQNTPLPLSMNPIQPRAKIGTSLCQQRRLRISSWIWPKSLVSNRTRCATWIVGCGLFFTVLLILQKLTILILSRFARFSLILSLSRTHCRTYFLCCICWRLDEYCTTRTCDCTDVYLGDCDVDFQCYAFWKGVWRSCCR